LHVHDLIYFVANKLLILKQLVYYRVGWFIQPITAI